MDYQKAIVKPAIIVIALIAIIILYKIYNPVDSIYFPKCPFKVLTGYKCPGCGSQRAIHHLLNVDIPGAFRENPLLVMLIPYLIVGFLFDSVTVSDHRLLKWRKFFFGEKAIYVLLTVIVSFWVLRNVTDFIP